MQLSSTELPPDRPFMPAFLDPPPSPTPSLSNPSPGTPKTPPAPRRAPILLKKKPFMDGH
jgi:hypothetical protein